MQDNKEKKRNNRRSYKITRNNYNRKKGVTRQPLNSRIITKVTRIELDHIVYTAKKQGVTQFERVRDLVRLGRTFELAMSLQEAKPNDRKQKRSNRQ